MHVFFLLFCLISPPISFVLFLDFVFVFVLLKRGQPLGFCRHKLHFNRRCLNKDAIYSIENSSLYGNHFFFFKSRLRKEIQLYIHKWVFIKYLVVMAHIL